MIKIGIIGGTGVNLDILNNTKQIKVHTPFGNTSDLVTIGFIGDKEIVFIPRHGNKHSLNPTNVPYKANIYAMKEMGVTHIIAPCAVGSLKEEIKPGDLVFTDQFIDRTTKRDQSFYNGSQVCHIPMGEPFCPNLREILAQTAEELRIKYHKKGTNVVMEGPRFSSKSESEMYRMFGADTINMTMIPEVVLAREAGICYAAIAMVTDYDNFSPDNKPVDIAFILETMRNNVEKVKKIIGDGINKIPEERNCVCKDAIKESLI